MRWTTSSACPATRAGPPGRSGYRRCSSASCRSRRTGAAPLYRDSLWRQILDAQRRVAARIEASTRGLDIRFVVTNLEFGNAEWLYDSRYCARGQAENLIKLHKSQLAS